MFRVRRSNTAFGPVLTFLSASDDLFKADKVIGFELGSEFSNENIFGFESPEDVFFFLPAASNVFFGSSLIILYAGFLIIITWKLSGNETVSYE